MTENIDPETGEVIHPQLLSAGGPAPVKEEEEPHLPVGNAGEFLMSGGGSPALAIMLNDRLFERTKLLAKYMAAADGFTPRHLIGKLEACFAVVTRALIWKLDPFAVASSTYQTPGGAVGYEGKLIIAILENSGKLAGGVRFEHYGDWSKVQNKFEVRKSDKGRDYAVPAWGEKEAAGLGVIVRAQMRGEAEPRELTFELAQAFPRNSTLWATDPKTQICYTAARRFASLACPGVLMGVPFDVEDNAEPAMRDVTPALAPRPRRPLVSAVDADDEPAGGPPAGGSGGAADPSDAPPRARPAAPSPRPVAPAAVFGDEV
jgi:hypothetical protein